METQEARIKCTGCGMGYKLKVPMSDQPFHFKCKKCGKVLKVRVKPAFAATQAIPPPTFADEPPPPVGAQAEQRDKIQQGQIPGFETTQLPDEDHPAVAGIAGLESFRTPNVVENNFFAQSVPEPAVAGDSERRWLALANEQVKGPFNDQEVIAMIKDGEISGDTSLRHGQRPWIKAVQIAEFRGFFKATETSPHQWPVASMPMQTTKAPPKMEAAPPPGPPFYQEIPSLIPYPVRQGYVVPLAIFFGIAFVVSAVLSANFLIGLPVCIAGWILLYGYLSTVMKQTIALPANPPPAWDFSRAGDMVKAGVNIFLVLFLYSLLPTSVCLLLMIAGFLNGWTGMGYVFVALTVLVYLASLLAVPAGLTILERSHQVGRAMAVSKVMALAKGGSKAYQMLAFLTIGLGFLCLVVTLAAVFLAGIPVAGSIVAGLVMALAFAYIHFVWFHSLGRFSRENEDLLNQVLAN